MTNVLPSNTQTAIMRKTSARFLLTGGIILTCSGIIACLSLVPAFLAAQVPENSASGGANGELVAQEQEDRKTVTRLRTFLIELSPFLAEKISVHDAMQTALALAPEDISITGVGYKIEVQEQEEGKDPIKTGQITITGVASRDDVNAFREALIQEPTFKSVAIPVAALVGAREGNFTMTLSGDF